jgi:hypothetical protein
VIFRPGYILEESHVGLKGTRKELEELLGVATMAKKNAAGINLMIDVQVVVNNCTREKYQRINHRSDVKTMNYEK